MLTIKVILSSSAPLREVFDTSSIAKMFFDRLPERAVGQIIATALTPAFEGRRGELTERVTAIADRYPLYAQLGTPAHA